MNVIETPGTLTLEQLQDAFEYRFQNIDLLETALTHKSFANEQSIEKVILDNERLEFLGDAVLDLALSDCLMRKFSQDPEGSLSKKRASLVNEETLSQLALELRLNDVIRLGRGEAKTGGVQKPRILASSLEAIFGAIFVDGGYLIAVRAIERTFEDRLAELGLSQVDFHQDFKTRLQEKTQEKYRQAPIYQVESEKGPDHDKVFEVSVRLNSDSTVAPLAIGTGRSKKAAEQDAARKALEQIMES